MNDKRKYLTEKDFKQLSLISHENYLEAIKKKEQLIKNLPYSDDILDIENKENLYKDVCVTTFMEISAFISVPFTYKYIKYRYPGQYSHLKYLMNFPKVFLMIFSWSESMGKSLPSFPHCEMWEEAVGTFLPLHYLVVSTVLIAEYSEPKAARKYIISPTTPPPPPPFFCNQSMRGLMMKL